MVVWCVGRWTYRGVVVLWLLLLLVWFPSVVIGFLLRVVVSSSCKAGRVSAHVVLSGGFSSSCEAGRDNQRWTCLLSDPALAKLDVENSCVKALESV